MRLALFALWGLAATGCITDPTLYVDRTGRGTGRIVSDPKGIDCGTTCGMNVGGSGRVTLTAIPGASSYFAGWTGACEDSLELTCSFDVIDQMEVRAAFGLSPQMLTIVPAPGGRVTAPGLDCGASCMVEYPFATDVLITATPNPGYYFGGWTDGSMNTTRIYTMNKAVTLEARYVAFHDLRVTVVGTGAGRVYSEPGGINCMTMCSSRYNEGTLVTLTAEPIGGSMFAGWSNCTPVPNQPLQCVVSVTGSIDVSATFY